MYCLFQSVSFPKFIYLFWISAGCCFTKRPYQPMGIPQRRWPIWCRTCIREEAHGQGGCQVGTLPDTMECWTTWTWNILQIMVYHGEGRVVHIRLSLDAHELMSHFRIKHRERASCDHFRSFAALFSNVFHTFSTGATYNTSKRHKI